MRLIDADAYEKKVCTYRETGCGDCKFQICCPNDQPTAYDIDKVVEQLEKIEVSRSEYSEIVECNIEPCTSTNCCECVVNKAIEIVKGGAV